MLLAQQNVGFLDAPVTGAPQRAANGTLTVMVGRLRRMKYGICGLLLHAYGIFLNKNLQPKSLSRMVCR